MLCDRRAKRCFKAIQLTQAERGRLATFIADEGIEDPGTRLTLWLWYSSVF